MFPPPAPDHDDTKKLSLHVPLMSMYFAFALDFEKTLEICLCDIDDATAAEIRQLPRRTYAGFCVSFIDFPLPGREFHRITVRPLQHDLTIPGFPQEDVTEDMCVPVFPETSHPLSRIPLKTTKPLPWEHCYHPTCLDVDIRTPKGYYDYSDSPMLETESSVQAAIYVREDNQRLRDTPVNGDNSHQDTLPVPPMSSPFEQLPANLTSDDIWDRFVEFVEDADPDKDEVFTPVVQMSPDLSLVTELSGGKQLLLVGSLVQRCQAGPAVNVPDGVPLSAVTAESPDRRVRTSGSPCLPALISIPATRKSEAGRRSEEEALPRSAVV